MAARGSLVVLLSLTVHGACAQRRGPVAAGTGAGGGAAAGAVAGSAGSPGMGSGEMASGGAAGGGAAGGAGGAIAAGGTGGAAVAPGGTDGAAGGAGGAGAEHGGGEAGSAGGAGAVGGNAQSGRSKLSLLGPIVPTNQTGAALIHAVAVTSASRDGARLAGLSSYYATTSTVEGATRFYWTERSGQVSLGPASGIDIGLYDAPKVSADGSATFGCLVRTRANGPNSTITYPYSFYRWTTTSGYVPFGPSPELANGQIDHVSDDGTVALGLASLTQGGEYRPFRWTLADGYHELEGLPGWPPMSNYLALSRDGRVILALSSPATTFLWSDSGAVTIPSLPGHAGCVANLLSGDGSVVFGTCAAPTSQGAGTSAIQKFRWTATTGTVAIGAASNQLFVTTTADGTVAMGNGDGALSRWTAGGGLVTVQPPDTVFSTADYWLSMTATSLSEDGSAVYGSMGPRAASTEPGDSGTESFRWSTRDGFVRLRPLPGDDVSTIASASADGSVHTGLSRAGRRGKARAVLWDRLGPRDIAAELTAAGISLDGVELLEGSMVWSGPLIMVVGSAASAGGSRAWIAWLPAR